jgi:hypothetical protein
LAEKPRPRFQWKDRYWRTMRSAVQASALMLFLFLFVRTVRGGIPPLAANLFLRLDPLAMLAGLLASKTTCSIRAAGKTNSLPSPKARAGSSIFC